MANGRLGVNNKKSFFLYISDFSASLMRSISWVVVGNGISRLIHLLLMILIARSLGVEDFGRLGLLISTIGFLSLLSGLGFSLTVTKHLAEFVPDEKEKASRVCSLVTILTLFSLGFWTLLLIMSSPAFSEMIYGTPEYYSLVIVATVHLWMVTLRSLQDGFFAGLGRFDLLGKLAVFEGVLILPLVLVLVSTIGIYGAILGMAIGSFVTLVVALFLIRVEVLRNSLRINFKDCWSELPVIWKFSIPVFSVNLIATPVLWVAMVILSRSSGGHFEVGVYSAAYQWHGPLIFIPGALLPVVFSKLTSSWANGEVEEFRKICLLGAVISIVVATLPALFLASNAALVMRQYGSQFEGSVEIMIVLMIAAPFHAILKFIYTVLYSMSKAWAVFRINIIWSIVFLAGTVYFVPVAGAKGLANTFLGAYFLSCLVGVCYALYLYGIHNTKSTHD